ncbi:BON domain-containing protein [Devosia sp.]|uniref:BON domain-containing protein n=1 Tax=Devosia sp. TaxID=1871048 RepID=UPI003263CC6B
MSSALAGFDPGVSGSVAHGRAVLSGEVATEGERQLIERSVLRLHCVTDVIDDIVVRPPAPAADKSRASPWTTAEVVQPIIFLTSYCTLREDMLADAINDGLGVLSKELHGSAGAAEVIVFYYGWHNDAALIDIAIPAADALDRPRANILRASILPHSKRSIVPTGGVTGLRSARRQLRLKAGALITDQIFRIWQRVPLRNGALPENWLGAIVYCAV